MKRVVIMTLAAFLGLGLTQYPTAVHWLADRAYANQVVSYGAAVSGVDNRTAALLLEEAREYNQDVLRGIAGHRDQKDVERYFDLLSIPDLAMMGTVSIPDVGIYLPFYHGTADEVLESGAGHVYGTTLPVGGEGHSVITAHSGRSEAKLFTALHDVRVGDAFSITVLNQTFYYVVDGISVIEPGDIEAVAPIPGEDRVTLYTCTPLGLNTHRLLVRGIRTSPELALTGETAPGYWVRPSPGFPWWAVIWLGGTTAIFFIAKRIHTPGTEEAEPDPGAASDGSLTADDGPTASLAQ